MQGLGPPPWAAFTGMSGQPTGVGNPQAFQLGGVDPSGVIVGALPGYVRLTPNTPQASLLPGTSIHTSTPYGSANQPLGYALPHSMEASLTGRQISNTSLPPTYQLPTFPLQNGSTSQSVPFSHPTLPCGQSALSYFHQFMPSLCNGGIGAAVQHCSTVNNPTSLIPGTEPLRFLDSLKHFSNFPSDQKRRTKPMTTSRTNLYISGLSESDTDETVRCLVKDVVQPKSCKAVVCNGICKGYGFIDCASDEDAEKAIAHILEFARVSGRKLMVKFAYENEKDALNVYVKHLPLDYTKDHLKNLFREYGQITSVKLLEKESGPTGDGFVRYTYAYEASKAIEELNAKMLVLGSNTSPVLCKLADKANTRRRGLMTTTSTTNATHPGLTSALFQSNQIPLANPNPMRAPNAVNTVTGTSVYRGPTLTHLAQQPSTLPFAASQLHPVQLMLHNMQCGANSPQLRNILSPGGMSNGLSNPMPSIINPISSSVPSASVHPSILSNRSTSTPLMGPPPTTVAMNSSLSGTPPFDVTHPVSNDSITEITNSMILCSMDKSAITKTTVAAQPTYGKTSPTSVPMTPTSTTIDLHENSQIYLVQNCSETETNNYCSSPPTFCSYSSQSFAPSSTQPNCELSLISVSTAAIHPNFPVQSVDSQSKIGGQDPDITLSDRQLVIVAEPKKLNNGNQPSLKNLNEGDESTNMKSTSSSPSYDVDEINGSDSLSYVSPELATNEFVPNETTTPVVANQDHLASSEILSVETKHLVENHTKIVHRKRVIQSNSSGPNIVSTQCDQ